MRDFFAPAIPAQTVFSDRLRAHPVIGDGMYPLLRGGWDYVLLAPVSEYHGEGIYLVHNGLGEELFRVTPAWDGKKGIRLMRENKAYSDQVWTLEQFRDGVLGIVVADIKMRDERFLRGI